VPARTVGRIRTRAAFAQLQRSRARASQGPVRATFVPADPADPGVFPQVGYAIGKNCGSAVVRNTLRRRMRETARSISSELPRGTYLLRVAPSATAIDSTQFRTSVTRALLAAGTAGTPGQSGQPPVHA
jgi:ribonuclease P protein component